MARVRLPADRSADRQHRPGSLGAAHARARTTLADFLSLAIGQAARCRKTGCTLSSNDSICGHRKATCWRRRTSLGGMSRNSQN